MDNSQLGNGGYAECSDEQLAVMAKNNDRQAALSLISKYICTIEARAGSFVGGVYDDLIQEGLMGLMKAVQTFDAEKEVKFATYAITCIRNRMISAFNKDKASLEEISGEDDEASGHDPADIPENIVLEKERMNEIFNKIYSALSELEWRVFQFYLSGLAYNQIALKLGVSVKTVNNAMQRVRRKLKAVLR